MLLVCGRYCVDTYDFHITDVSSVYSSKEQPFVMVNQLDGFMPSTFKGENLCFATRQVSRFYKVIYVWYDGYYFELICDLNQGVIKLNNIVITRLRDKFVREGLKLFGIFYDNFVVRAGDDKTVYIKNGTITTDSSAEVLGTVVEMSRSAFLRKVFIEMI